MVEKIIVNPLSVRGYGDIVSPKTLEDFDTFNSSLSYEDSFFTMEFTESDITLSLTVSSGTVTLGDSVTCTATVLDSETPVSGASVRFYDGNSVLGTVESDANGVAVLSLSTLSAGAHSIVASYGGQSSSVVSVTVNKLTTSISLSSNKASCYIDETFTLSGTLSRGEGYTVYLYTGNTLVDTLTTGANGEFTKTVTPSSAGSFSYTARYNGDSSYSECASSVSVNVVKRTPTLSLSAQSTTITVGEAPVLSGVLSVGSGEYVKIYRDSDLIYTATTGTGGAFSYTDVATSSTGSLDYVAVYEGNVTFNSVVSEVVEVTVSSVTPTYDGITLTSDKSVLSYYDSDSCTLSAQLKNGSSVASVSGVTVEFFNGSTSLGTATTDSTGKATKSYSSQGIGDISITAKVGSLVSETYSIEDLHKYDSGATDQTSKYSTMNANSFVHSTDHYELGRTLSSSDTSKYYTVAYLTDYNLPTNYELSVDFLTTDYYNQDEVNIVSAPTGTYQSANEFGIISTGVRYGLFNRVNGSGTWYTTDGHLNSNIWYTFIIQVEGTTVTATIKNGATTVFTNSKTISNASSFKKFTMICGNNAHTIKFKNLKVKSL